METDDDLVAARKKLIAEPSLRRMLRGGALMVTTSFRAAPLLATGVVTFTAASALASPLVAVLAKRLADGVVRGDRDAVVRAAVGAAIVAAGAYVLNMYGIAIFRMTMEERTRLHIERHILRLVAGLPGIEHHERPEYADEVALFRSGQGLLSQPAGPVVFLFSYALMGVTTLTLLARLHPLLLLLPLAGIPPLLTAGVGARIGRKADEAVVERRRHQALTFHLATNPVAGKELRIFGLGPELMRRQARGQDEVLAERGPGRTHWPPPSPLPAPRSS